MLEEEAHRLPRPKRRAILLEEEAHRLARRLAADRDGNPTALVRRLIKEEAQRDESDAWDPQDGLLNPAHIVYFRAGLLACRETMAGFVEAVDPSTAASIRANWWPDLGEDPGPPRLLDFNEVTDGGEEGPWDNKPIAASVEALPIAYNFLNRPATGKTEAER